MADPDSGPFQSVRVSNRAGRGQVVVVCEHASNHLPAEYGTLGLSAEDLTRHIAWDPGALPVARVLASLLDAPLVESGVSRLVIDCNRPLDAPDLVPTLSESTEIPGNQGLSPEQLARRIELSHRPFHEALDALIAERCARQRPTWVVSIHSFTPVWKGTPRPWHVGVIHDEDARLAAPLVEALAADPKLVVAANEPYSPADRVYYTIERHARSRNLPCAMIELRNDIIAGTSEQRRWGETLARVLSWLDLGREREDSVA